MKGRYGKNEHAYRVETSTKLASVFATHGQPINLKRYTRQVIRTNMGHLQNMTNEILDKIAGGGLLIRYGCPLHLPQDVQLNFNAPVQHILMARGVGGSEIDIEHVKCLRASNRECRVEAAAFLLQFSGATDVKYLDNAPGSEYEVPRMKRPAEGHLKLLDVCVQWVRLACIEILNINSNGTTWTAETKMKVFTFLRSTNAYRGYPLSFVCEALTEVRRTWMADGKRLEWRAFSERLTRALMRVCEDKGFDPEIMQKIALRALQSLSGLGINV